jgi:hypothetical protein
MIATRQHENGEWEAYTSSSPYMSVRADSELIAFKVMTETLVWYEERRLLRIAQAQARAAQMLEAEIYTIDGIDVDHDQAATIDQVMDFSVDSNHYMNGDAGC